MLIIGGPSEDEEKPKKPMAAMKKFVGLGGKYDFEKSDSEMEETGAEGSSDAENVRLFFEAGKAGKYERAMEALRALVQSCTESGDE
jgi:hypothetical protein